MVHWIPGAGWGAQNQKVEANLKQLYP